MRKTSLSSKCSASSAFSARAEARSWPNGFSMISRTQPSAARRSAIALTIVPIALGGTARS